MTKAQLADKKEAIDRLHNLLKPGDIVYTDCKSVSRSGMYRRIRCYIKTDNGIMDISHLVARACEYPLNDKGLGVSGCGMDMGFAVVYDLCYCMFPDGFDCIGPKCPSNDHTNGDRDLKPHLHKSGAYALKQSWL